MPKFCTKCGTQLIDDTSLFCNNCGSKLSTSHEGVVEPTIIQPNKKESIENEEIRRFLVLC